MKLASAASLTELINGAENLMKTINEDGVVYVFFKTVCVICVCVYIYIFLFLFCSLNIYAFYFFFFLIF